MMVTLTKEDLDILKAPFKAKEHEFLGKFTYIKEFSIVTRIEEVDPAWEFVITALDSRPAMGDKDQVQVTCTAALTISGVTRYGVGQMKAYETKPYVDKETGETKQTEEANEAEKSAATDALKRAARLFGIGRYLLMLPKDVKNEKQLGVWIKKALDAKAKAEGLQDADDTPYEDTRPYHGMPAATVEDAIFDMLLEGIEEKHDLNPHEWEDDSDLDVDQSLPTPRRSVPDNRTPDYQDGAWSSDEIADQVVGGYEDAEYYPADTSKERYTTPTNIVVTKAGKGDKLYMVIEGCTFFTREAFRLLDYDGDIIDDLAVTGVTKLPDTVTVVYVKNRGFKTPVRIQRNSTNAVVDVTNAPFLLKDSEKV